MADVNDDAEGRRSTESLAAEVVLDAAEVTALYEAMPETCGCLSSG